MRPLILVILGWMALLKTFYLRVNLLWLNLLLFPWRYLLQILSIVNLPLALDMGHVVRADPVFDGKDGDICVLVQDPEDVCSLQVSQHNVQHFVDVFLRF